MKTLLSTKEVAHYLGVNQKMVYTLISEKGLPASKVTGKWIFPRHLVAQWVEAHTLNLPSAMAGDAIVGGLLVLAGSNDPLLEQAIGLHNRQNTSGLAVFGNLGSMGGVRALKQQLCQVATSHLMPAEGDDYNFDYIGNEVLPTPVVVNFCRRRQGLVAARDNPKDIRRTADLDRPDLRVVNRKLGTGTRLLFDRELKTAGLEVRKLAGYDHEVDRHMDVGLAVLSGKADAGPCIQPVAELLGLHFIPWRWERYDLLILRERFFDPAVQRFIGLLHEKAFHAMAEGVQGYDLSATGRMIFPSKVENE